MRDGCDAGDVAGSRHAMRPEQVQLVREHQDGQHAIIRHQGCPICLELSPAPAPWRVDPEPWIEQLRRRRR